MRAAWGGFSARQRQLATNFDDPLMTELYCHVRIELSKAVPCRAEAVKTCIGYGVQELSLNKEGASFHVQWNPAGGFKESTVELIFKHAVRSLAEFHELMAETRSICKQMPLGDVPVYGSKKKDAPMRFLGKLFYTTVLLQLLQTQITKESTSPPKLRSAKDSRRLAASLARKRAEQYARSLLAQWAAQSLCKKAPEGSAGAWVRASPAQLAEHLLAQGWSLRVKNTFYEALQTKQAPRRHSFG
jgi:hypothetical protein